MVRKLIVPLLIALIVVATAAPANAQAAPPTPKLEEDYASALSWWGQASPPLCSTVTLSIVTEVVEPLSVSPSPDGITAAQATIPTEPEYACALTAYEPTWGNMTSCERKVVARHEVGHLLGYGHSSDRRSVMYPTLEPSVWCPMDEVVAQALAELPRLRSEWNRIRVACEHLTGSRASDCWWVARSLRTSYKEALHTSSRAAER